MHTENNGRHETKIFQLCDSYEGVRFPPKVICTIAIDSGAYIETAYLRKSKFSKDDISHFNQSKSYTLNIASNFNNWLKIKLVKKLYTKINGENFDIVVTHRYKPFLLCLLASRFTKNTRYFAIFHGNGSFKKPLRQFMCRALLDNKWHLIAVSNSVKRDILSTLGQTKSELSVIYNCLDIKAIENQQLSKIDARKHLELDENKTIFGCTARLVSGKGINYLIQAFEQLKHYEDLQLVILGDGPEKENLMKNVISLNIEDRVTFCGYVDNAFKYAPAFDLFILPSSNEAFGLVLLEAAAAKIPILATTAGGIPEVAEGTELVLVPPKNPSALKVAMSNFYDLAPSQRKVMGDRIYNQLFNKFDISRISDQYHRVLGLTDSRSSIEDK